MVDEVQKLNIVLMMVGSSMILSAVCMMQHQNQGFGHRMPQQSPYQQDVGAATLKTPPAWCYENAAQYTLRSWLSDVLMWSSATDVEVERQGPAVALQITGVARDLIREINPQHLREGIHEQGVHIPGLMLLCRTLANHFAPLESELQDRAMAELMNFARMGHETIDVSLTRFEVLRHRAAQRGGLNTTTTLSYLLLNGLRLRPEQWERALMPLDGQLPHDDAAFQQLFDRLRRIGRMHEGHFNPPNKQGATGDVGYHFFPTFDNPNPMPGTGFGMDYSTYYGGNQHNAASNTQPEQSPFMPEMPSSSGLQGSQSFASVPITEDEEQCTRCGMFYEDEFSSGTESDDGEADSEASQIYAQFESDPSICWVMFCMVITCWQNSVGVGFLVDCPEDIVEAMITDFASAAISTDHKSMAKLILHFFPRMPLQHIVDLVERVREKEVDLGRTPRARMVR